MADANHSLLKTKHIGDLFQTIIHSSIGTAALAVSPRMLSSSTGRLTLLRREATGVMCLDYLVDFISDSY